MWWRVRHFFRFLKRLCDWLPILWDDEDWDSNKLFRIMQFKISRIRKCIEKNQRHTCADRNVRDMRIAELYLDRFINDTFPIGNAYFCTCPLEMMIQDSEGATTFHFCNACREYLGTLESTRIRRKMKKGQRFYGMRSENQAWENFCKHFMKHSRKWWD